MTDRLQQLRFGDIVVDRDAFRVTRDGRDLALEPRAVDVLLYLMDRSGRLVPKQELIAEVWKGTAVTDNALTRVVAQLRKALGDEARGARYIETIPTRGYRFIAELSVANGPEAPGPAGSRRRLAPLLWTAAVLGALAIGLAIRQGPAGDRQSNPSAAAPVQISFAQALDVFQSFSPDGQSLAFSSSRTGAFQIYVASLAPGGRAVPVTDGDGQFVQPAWSPDGRYLAYHSMARGGIWIMPATGGAARQVARFGSRPAWSPDATRLAFQSGPIEDLSPEAFGAVSPSTIWTVSIDTGASEPITRPDGPPGGHAAPAWSPDGRFVVFSSRRYPSGGLWRVEAGGGPPVRLEMPDLGGWVSDPAWAPDGRSIVFSTVSELWRLPVDPATGTSAGAPAPLVGPSVPALRHPSFSPDGGRLAYSLVSLASNLRAVRLDASGAAAGPPFAITRDTSRRNTLPAVAPDGARVAYQSTRTGAGIDVWVAGMDGSGGRQVTTHPGFDGQPVWLRDPPGLAYVAKRGDVASVRVLDPDSGEERELLSRGLDDESLADATVALTPVAPDGLRVALALVRDGVSNIWVRALDDDGPARQITFDPEFAGWPSWSPDGRSIAYEIKRGDATQVAVVSSEGGAPIVLTEGPGANWPYGWSPDGERVAYASLQDGVWNVWWVALGDGVRRQVTTYGSPDVYVRYPAWSPAGDVLVYEFGEVRGNVWAIDLPRSTR